MIGKENKVWGWHYGTEGKAASGNAGIPYGIPAAVLLIQLLIDAPRKAARCPMLESQKLT